jgi:subtilisin family serine protease
MQQTHNNKSTGVRFVVLMALVAVLALTALTVGAAPSGGMAGDAPGKAQPASGRVQSYVVLMKDLPLVAYDGAVEGFEATAPAKGEKLDVADAEARSYDSYLRAGHERVLRGAGLERSAMVNEYTVALNGFSALLTAEQAEALARQPGVLRVSRDTWRQKQTDASPGFLGINGPGEAWDMGYDGEGVVVGVIDSGIWPEHPSFADDGSYPEPPITLEDTVDNPACEFGNIAHNPDDAPFTCNNKLIGARQMMATYRAITGADPDEFDSARDDDGHGTHTASTAAGNMDVMAAMLGLDRGMVSGIAPRAHVMAYKGLGNLGGYGSDLAAAIDQAVADGVDVINYSVGGGPSLSGDDDIAYLFAADAGIFVATSAGNSGPTPGSVGGPGTVPWITTVGASTQPRSFQGTVTLGNGATYTGVSITPSLASAPLVDAADAGDDLCNIGALDENMVDGAIVLCRRGAIARVDKSFAVYDAGGVGMIMYENSDAGDLMSDPHWVPSVHLDNTPGLAIKAYIASAASPTASITGQQLGTLDYAPSMTSFSSRGPNVVAEDIIKPDITGPGIQILAGNSPFPDPGQVPNELFMAIAGTSMSSPHVAGVFALLKDAHPDWSAAAAKSAIMTSSYQDVTSNDRTTQATPFEMGAGHVNPGKPGDMGTAFNPGLVYDIGFNGYLAFMCSAGPEIFGNAAATCAALEGMGYSLDESDLNLPSIGIAELAGSQTVTRTVSDPMSYGYEVMMPVIRGGNDLPANYDYTVLVDAPEGFTVEVSPDMFNMTPGGSVTYEVTITAESAPVGEWRFGSLTWKGADGVTDVYSPIAVKGAQIGIPAEIEGEGEDGDASFNVNFGYSGEYDANAHGLEPANVVDGNVKQDPDQEFDPDDGFSESYTVPLNNVAFFRLVMNADDVGSPDADLDIFILNSAGDEVASSTNGGSNEQIDLVLPPDDTYTVWIHGWQTAGPNVDFTFYWWEISATPGGNLTIDSQPADAVIGKTEPIDISWTGATAGEWHLGAVSHADADGLIGLTLVNVDNR